MTLETLSRGKGIETYNLNPDCFRLRLKSERVFPFEENVFRGWGLGGSD